MKYNVKTAARIYSLYLSTFINYQKGTKTYPFFHPMNRFTNNRWRSSIQPVYNVWFSYHQRCVKSDSGSYLTLFWE